MGHLVDIQDNFLGDVAKLITWIRANGYQVTGGELHRPPITAEAMAKQGKGIKASLHCDRLAVDLMLFKDGEYLSTTERYKPLGDYWKSLHPDNRWGGDFQRKDGNHFSRGYQGRA